jgi:hypothetical protein
MLYGYDEDMPAPVPSLQDHMRDYANQHGALEPERAWILTPFDTWLPNPHYVGPRVPHPEADWDELQTEADALVEAGDYVAALPNADGEWDDIDYAPIRAEARDALPSIPHPDGSDYSY